MPRFTLAMCGLGAMIATFVGCNDSEPLPPRPTSPATPSAEKPAERKPDKPVLEGSPIIDDLAVRKRPDDR